MLKESGKQQPGKHAPGCAPSTAPRPQDMEMKPRAVAWVSGVSESATMARTLPNTLRHTGALSPKP